MKREGGWVKEGLIERPEAASASERAKRVSEPTIGIRMSSDMIMSGGGGASERAKRVSELIWLVRHGAGERSEPDTNERAKRASEPHCLGRHIDDRASGGEIGDHGPLSTVFG
jgi:hypothetical protein